MQICNPLELNFGEGWYWNSNKACPYRVIIPEVNGISQGHEYVYIEYPSGEQVKFPIHHYTPMYSIPYLYEEIVYRHLICRTPGGMINVIEQAFRSRNVFNTADLYTLEIGAGPGTFGEFLKKYFGVRNITGLDIEPLAKIAAERDRPDLYSEYVIADLCRLSSDMLETAGTWDFIVIANATGWNHIPIEGLQQAFDLLRTDGWFVINLNRVDPEIGCQAASNWINGLIATGQLDLVREERVFHRKGIDGHDIFYNVIIGIKGEQK